MTRLLFLAFAALYLSAFGRDRFDAWVDKTVLPPLTMETSVEVLDRNGHLLRAFTVADGRWRLTTSVGAVDPAYLDMLIAYEDKRFHRHHGVDPLAAMRAIFQAIQNGKMVSGASTLTMQAARLLEDGPTGTWTGKLRQVRLAFALERHLSKETILEIYLNRAPFGGNLEGVRAASLAYFGKEPSRLTPAEAALLVALPQSPERRRPDRNLAAAKNARDSVLERLFGAQRAHYLSKLEPVPAERRVFPKNAPHLAQRLIQGNPGLLRHRTTIDLHLQARLETLTQRAAQTSGDQVSAAVLVADHRTGEIIASIGSAGYQNDTRAGFVDMTRAVRSPGSTLKPLVYGLAFDQGLAHPETLMEDKPVRFGSYAPQNFDNAFRGTVKVRDALLMSLNIPVVTLTSALGPARVMSHLRRSGANPKLNGTRPGLAVALGGMGLSLNDLVQLYAGIANQGRSVSLSAVTTGQSNGAQVMSASAAWHIADILSQATPPQGASQTGLAYKTGTSYGHRDAWAVGFDGAHVIGVWMGRPDGTPVPGAFGGDLAAPVLFDAFAILKPELERLPAPPADALLVSHSNLPGPLKRFGSRNKGSLKPAPQLVFPPDGAQLTGDLSAVFGKVRDGTAPFTWLLDGAPLLTQTYERDVSLGRMSQGFRTLTVIDATGQSSQSRVRFMQ